MSSSTRTEKKKLALFDFDGTITTKDTFIEFIRFYHGNLKFAVGFSVLAPILVLFKLKLIANWKAKEKVLTWFFKGETLGAFSAKCLEFSKHKLPGLIRPKAVATIKGLAAEYEIVVVSASAEDWIAPWCNDHHLNVLATTLEKKDGKLTGKIAGKNCFGIEKALRIQAKYNLASFDEILSYGDSSGDREMFALSHKYFYKPFRD
jgi:phosphatidylglycerophosphatase C